MKALGEMQTSLLTAYSEISILYILDMTCCSLFGYFLLFKALLSTILLTSSGLDQRRYFFSVASLYPVKGQLNLLLSCYSFFALIFLQYFLIGISH